MEYKQNKTKTTNSERCKCYQEKHSEKYRNQDALRKKRSRLILKFNNAAHEEYKRKKKGEEKNRKIEKKRVE